MPIFSKTSQDKLNTCDIELRRLFTKVISNYDCTVLAGHRTEEEQMAAFAANNSKVKWPNSKHNTMPSQAIDIAPYPINWGNTGSEIERRKAIARFYHFAGYVQATADDLGISVRWGGDWDSDKLFDDQHFDDLPHWELK